MTVRYKADLELGKEHKFLTSFSQLIVYNRAWPLKLAITQDSLNRLYITLKPGWYVDIKPEEPKRFNPDNLPEIFKHCIVYEPHHRD